jgi:hypothetical protein
MGILDVEVVHVVGVLSAEGLRGFGPATNGTRSVEGVWDSLALGPEGNLSAGVGVTPAGRVPLPARDSA